MLAAKEVKLAEERTRLKCWEERLQERSLALMKFEPVEAAARRRSNSMVNHTRFSLVPCYPCVFLHIATVK